MSNYNNLKTSIDANIKQNGNQEITGPILNSVLNQIVNILGTGYQFAGVATLDPATDPGTPDAKVFYIANGKGTYTNFGGIEVTEDDVVVLYWDSAWHKVATGIASQAKLSELEGEISILKNAGYLYAGVATPTTDPGTPNVKVFYIANGKGIYTNFGGLEVTEDEVVILCYDTAWYKEVTGIASNQILSSVASKVDRLTLKDIIEDGFYICDENGNVVMRLDVFDTKNPIGDNLKAAISNISLDSIFAKTIDSGMYIANEQGDVIAQFVEGTWSFLNERKGFVSRTGNMVSGDEWILTSNSVKNYKRLVFSGNVTSFDTLTIGHGKSGYLASWIIVDNNNVTLHYYTSKDNACTPIPHNLTIMNCIQVEVWKDNSMDTSIKIVSNGTSFSYTFKSADGYKYYGDNGNIFVSTTSQLNDCIFSWTVKNLDGGLWLFGDSYLSLDDSRRWTYYLIKDGFTNFVLNGYSGAKTEKGLEDLRNLLKMALPKTIVWCLGMNDSDTSDEINSAYKSCLDSLISLCNKYGIELILSTIPTSYSTEPVDGNDGSSAYHELKNAFVRESGYRYIDFSKAVGADGKGNWYEGMKSPNDVHPTGKGAITLYQRAICDVPELLK